MKRPLKAMLWSSVSLFAILLIYLVGPTNTIDNALGLHRGSMIECTLKWGQLAPFPEEAQAFFIRTEGSSFTRTFRGSFTASPETVQAWLLQSPGVQQGQREDLRDHSSHFILKTGEGAAYGEVTISKDGTQVDFRVSWS